MACQRALKLRFLILHPPSWRMSCTISRSTGPAYAWGAFHAISSALNSSEAERLKKSPSTIKGNNRVRLAVACTP